MVSISTQKSRSKSASQGSWKKQTRKKRDTTLLEKWSANYAAIKQGGKPGSPTAPTVWVMDYANIVHTLYSAIGNFEDIKQVFMLFIARNRNLVIVAKPVFIHDQDYSIRTVLADVPDGNLPNIIEIEYKKSSKSNLDDLIFLWIAFVEYASGAKVMLLTNDRQDFRKNLFGMSPTEMQIKQSLAITQWKKGRATPASSEFLRWLKGIFHHSSANVAGLECNIMSVVSGMRGIATLEETTDIALEKVANCRDIGLIGSNGLIHEEYYLYACFKFMQDAICHDHYCSMTVDKILGIFIPRSANHWRGEPAIKQQT